MEALVYIILGALLFYGYGYLPFNKRNKDIEKKTEYRKTEDELKDEMAAFKRKKELIAIKIENAAIEGKQLSEKEIQEFWNS